VIPGRWGVREGGIADVLPIAILSGSVAEGIQSPPAIEDEGEDVGVGQCLWATGSDHDEDFV
jgi:hypothetical protein